MLGVKFDYNTYCPNFLSLSLEKWNTFDRSQTSELESPENSYSVISVVETNVNYFTDLEPSLPD